MIDGHDREVFALNETVLPDIVDAVADEVISFNLGGTIIAVLRSTLLRQAPDSTLTTRYLGRWTQQTDELDEDGNIYMVRVDGPLGCFLSS